MEQRILQPPLGFPPGTVKLPPPTGMPKPSPPVAPAVSKAEPEAMLDEPTLLDQIDSVSFDLKRAYAGYAHLLAALKTAQGIKTGRLTGMPIFEFTGSYDGVHTVQVRLDLAKIDPKHVAAMLIPWINLCAVQALQCFQSLAALGQGGEKFLRAQLATQAAQEGEDAEDQS